MCLARFVGTSCECSKDGTEYSNSPTSQVSTFIYRNTLLSRPIRTAPCSVPLKLCSGRSLSALVGASDSGAWQGEACVRPVG